MNIDNNKNSPNDNLIPHVDVDVELDMDILFEKKSLFSSLKSKTRKFWPKVKEKLNEDVNLKVEYTGVGVEPFVEIGKTIKRRFLKNENVMILGQDSACMPVTIDAESRVKSIPLEGSNHDFKLDKYSYGKHLDSLNLIGTSSGHSIENIVRNNIDGTKAFVIFISLSANDPLEEFYQYMELIEKYKIQDAFVLVVFLLEKSSQHDIVMMVDVIETEYQDQVQTMTIENKNKEMNLVFKQLIKSISVTESEPVVAIS